MDLNISLWGFLTVACYIIIFNFLTRSLVAAYPDTPVAKALLFLS